jgi:hypothetical protein
MTEREIRMSQDGTHKPNLAALLLRALDEDAPPPTSTDEPDRFVTDDEDGYHG